MKIKFKTIVCHFYCTINSEKMLKSPVCQGVDARGPKMLVSKDGNDTDSDESVYASAPGSEPHMDYEASISVRGPILYSHILLRGKSTTSMMVMMAIWPDPSKDFTESLI